MKKNKTEEIEFIIDENNRVDFRQVLQMINMYEEKIQKKQAIIDKATNELFILKDMIYKPETREENFEIQRKISLIIKKLNGKEAQNEKN